jgi:hypothetical protein
MRYMVIRKADKDTEAGVMPDEKLIAAMTRYNETLVKAGVMLAGEGLQPSAKGVRIKFAGSKASVTDGPFTESKELIAGFSMFEVKSREEVLDWVKRWPPEDAGGNVELEVRELGCNAGLPGIPQSEAVASATSKQRYMVVLKSTPEMEAGVLTGPEKLEAMARRNAQSVKAGVLVAGEGLQPSSKGLRVKFSGGRPKVIDGPFAEAKELVAGFWIIQVGSRDEAIAWASSYPYAPGADAVVEVRKVFEAADFGDAFTPELREAEERMREHIVKSGRQLGNG